MAPETTTTGTLKTNLEHLKRHVTYPATRNALVEACNHMSDASEVDRAWFTSNLPEGTYKAPEDVFRALLTKI